jgi:hypothetical protein
LVESLSREGKNGAHFHRKTTGGFSMFGQVTGYQIKPGKWSEFDRAFTEGVLPTLRTQHGFVEEIRMASDTMADRNVKNASRMESTTIWVEEKDLREYERVFGTHVMQILTPFLQGEPQIVDYSSVERSGAEVRVAEAA